MTLRSSSRNDGSVLIVTMLICGIMTFLMASYLSMVKTQNFSVARAQAWNQALVVAEAGVEEAMSHLNDTNTLKVGYAPVNKWIKLDSTHYWKSNGFPTTFVDASGRTNPVSKGYYNTWIVTTDPKHPVILSTGFVAGPLSSPILTRAVKVVTGPALGHFPFGAMIVSTKADFRGSVINTDSFNSTNELYSTGGIYDPAKATDQGDIVTISAADILDIQNAKVMGSLHVPVKGKYKVGSQGAVGDKYFVSAGSYGLQSGHVKYDAGDNYPDATLPDVGGVGWRTPSQGPFVINGVTYKYQLNSTYPWQLDDLDGSVYINGAGVKLYVKSAASIPNDGTIYIPTGKSLQMYVGAPSVNIHGVINDTGIARNFQYYGLPSNTALTFGGNATFTGMIYAPEADFTLGGGGSTPYDFSGLSVTKSAKMNGNFNFHFDAGALVALNMFGYWANSWDEL